MSRSLRVFLLICLCSLSASAASNKILIISSYGTDYQWSNNMMDAIEDKIANSYPHIEFVREFLSSEALLDTEKWAGKVSVLLGNYKDNPPKAIILISDEAWMAYQDADITAFKDVPLLLCAVKPHSISISDFLGKRDTLSLEDFSSTIDLMKKYQATAVIREMNVVSYLSLIHNLIDNLSRFVFITDSRFYGVYNHLLLQKEVKKLFPKIPVEYLDGRFVTTDSLLNHLSEIPSTAGVLMTSWLTGEHGFEYSKDFLYSQMENKLNTPIFITNNIGFEKEYFIGGYFNEASFWGEKTAEQALEILDGKNPHDIKPVIYCDDRCNISWKVLQHYNVNQAKLPSKVVFYNAPEPLWITYKKYVLVAGFVFLIFLLFYIYTLWSNVKLQQTKRLLIKSVDEVNASNLKLEKTQSELIVALHKAEESDRLKSAFLANMSHEIRTPLNAIVGFSGVLGEVEDEKEREEYVGLIKRNSDLLLQLLSDILDISRIEAGILEFTFSETDAADVCANVVTSLESKCKPGVELVLAQGATAMSIYTDPNRLMQVLINLVNNAIKFTSKGSIEVGYFACNDDTAEFYVKDTGMGIPADKQVSIFERFTKLNAYVEGTGLGLSICQTIIETMGGVMGVESQEGVGTRFWFRINRNQSVVL